MGSHARLWLSTDDSVLAQNGYVEDTELLNRWVVPVGWIAFFEPEDFRIEHTEEEGEAFSILFLSKPIDSAINVLKSRSAALSDAVGESWDQGIGPFIDFLAHPDAKFVIVDFTDLGDESYNVIEQRAAYIDAAKSFDVPVWEEKRTLFGKKTRMSAAWKQLLSQTTDYKPNVNLPLWAWFGGPPCDRDEWV